MHTCANCGKTFFHKPDHIFLDGKKRKLCGPGCSMKESIKDMGKATADGVKIVGGAAYSSTVGSGMQVSKEIGAEVANAGVALTGAARIGDVDRSRRPCPANGVMSGGSKIDVSGSGSITLRKICCLAGGSLAKISSIVSSLTSSAPASRMACQDRTNEMK